MIADPPEDEDARPRQRAAIEPDRRRTKPRLKRADIDKPPGNPVGIGARQFEQDPPRAAIDMDGEQALRRGCPAQRFG